MIGSYDHFCFFDHISNSTKTSDDFAFFVFFVFKSKWLNGLNWTQLNNRITGWKRVLLADAPRQTINALTLYAIFLAKRSNPGKWYDISKYFAKNSLSTSLLTVTTFLTVTVFAGSLLVLIVAAICYIPLLCHIRGNLKVRLLINVLIAALKPYFFPIRNTAAIKLTRCVTYSCHHLSKAHQQFHSVSAPSLSADRNNASRMPLNLHRRKLWAITLI